MPESTTNPESMGLVESLFWVGFVSLTLFVFLFGLQIPFVGPDEPRYAEVAREMFNRGDWITPTLGGFNWFEKPALLYWMEIAAFRVFGISEFAARLGPALCGLGTVLSLWVIARFTTLRGEEDVRSRNDFESWTALVAATTVGIVAFAHGASFDIVVTFPIAASLAGFFVFDNFEENAARWPLIAGLTAFYFFIGVALLAKGLIGLVFPFGIVALYFLLSRRWPSKWFLISLLWGLPLLVLVAATWYVPMYMRNGWQFINEFIIQQHFQRFTTNKYQHPQPFYFFFWVLPLMTIPWLPFFLAAIPKTAITLIQTIRRSTTSPSPRLPVSSSPLVLGASWLLVPLLFFSFSGSKLPGYILPAVPGAVLLTSVYIFRFIQKSTLRQRLVQAVAVGTYFVMVCAVIFAVPRFVRRESVNELIDSADSHGYASAPVLSFMTISHNAEFYAAGRLARDPDGKQHRFIGAHEVREYIDQHDGVPVVVLAPRDQIGHLSSSDLLETQVLNDNGDLDVAIVRWK